MVSVPPLASSGPIMDWKAKKISFVGICGGLKGTGEALWEIMIGFKDTNTANILRSKNVFSCVSLMLLCATLESHLVSASMMTAMSSLRQFSETCS